jgi:hypothetical protein
MTKKYINRDSHIITFIKEDDNIITMTGYYPGALRMSTDEEDKIIMVDPAGGPYLSKGQDMEQYGLSGIIKEFEFDGSSVKIYLE